MLNSGCNGFLMATMFVFHRRRLRNLDETAIQAQYFQAPQHHSSFASLGMEAGGVPPSCQWVRICPGDDGGRQSDACRPLPGQ
jgi:hypothetical protein